MYKYYLAYKNDESKYEKVDLSKLNVSENLQSLLTFIGSMGEEEELAYYLYDQGLTKNIEAGYAIVRNSKGELTPIPNCNISYIMNSNRLFSYNGIESYLNYRRYDIELWNTLLVRAIRRYRVTDKLEGLFVGGSKNVGSFYKILTRLLRYNISDKVVSQINRLIDYIDNNNSLDSKYDQMVNNLFITIVKNNDDLVRLYSVYSGTLSTMIPAKVAILRHLQCMCNEANSCGIDEFEHGFDHDNDMRSEIANFLNSELYTKDSKTQKYKMSYSSLCNLGMSISEYDEKIKRKEYEDDRPVSIIDPVTDEYLELEDFAGIDPELTLDDIEGMGYQVRRRGI